MILSFFRKDPTHQLATALYARIVEQARAPWFFDDLGAPDTVEGRFEILTIHMYLILDRLRRPGDSDPDFAQALFDVFFKNMDDSLRELGVGDLSVGKKIRAMAEAFYGRIGAYEQAGAGGDGALEAALSRNVYEAQAAPGAPALARYMTEASAALAAQGLNDVKTAPAFPRSGETSEAADEAVTMSASPASDKEGS